MIEVLRHTTFDEKDVSILEFDTLEQAHAHIEDKSRSQSYYHYWIIGVDKLNDYWTKKYEQCKQKNLKNG